MTTHTPAADLQLSLSRDALHRQNADIRLLNTKATILFGACLALFASETVSHFVPLLVLAVASLLAIVAIWPKTYQDGPRLARSEKILKEHTYDDSLDWLAAAFQLATEHNSKVLQRNGNIVVASAASLGLAIVLQAFIRFS